MSGGDRGGKDGVGEVVHGRIVRDRLSQAEGSPLALTFWPMGWLLVILFLGVIFFWHRSAS
jgi:hypothetical protein